MNKELIKILPKESLRELIEPHIYNQLSKNEYPIYRTKAVNLLTHNRFDLGFKLLYLKLKNKERNYAEEVYLSHIKAFSLGSFKEPYNSNKNGKDHFINEFEKIHETIKNIGFDYNKSLLPLSKSFQILNGAHRLASAIFLNKIVYFINTELEDVEYNVNYFYNRNVNPRFLNVAAVVFSEFCINNFLVLGFNNKKNELKTIKSIYYTKKIKIQKNQLELLSSFIKNFNQHENSFLIAYFYKIESDKFLKKLISICENENYTLIKQNAEIVDLAEKIFSYNNPTSFEIIYQKLLYLSIKLIKQTEKFVVIFFKFFGCYSYVKIVLIKAKKSFKYKKSSIFRCV